MSNKPYLFGYPSKKLDDALLRKIRAGLDDQPQLLFTVASPKAGVNRICKALNSTQDWSSNGETVYDSAGNGIYCMASWGERITAEEHDFQYRLQILHLDRFGRRDVYAIPMNRVTPPKELPGLEVTSDEVKLIFAMANATGGISHYEERRITVRHPLKATVDQQVAIWSHAFRNDISSLAALFREQPELISVVIAAADIQLRTLKNCRLAPMGLYNFVIPPGAATAEDWLMSVLRPLTFTTDIGSNKTGTIVISGAGEPAVAAWARCRGHLAVINSGGISVCNILTERLQEHTRLNKCQGYTPAPFPAPPITVTPSALCSSEALDTVLSDGTVPLTAALADMLRTAMALVLRDKEFACEVYDRWQTKMTSPFAYRYDSFRVWREEISNCLCRRWFHSDQTMAALFSGESNRQDQLAQERLLKLQTALTQLIDVEGYVAQICDKPASPEAARAALATAFAFWFTPVKGYDKGKKFLVFSVDSLTRFIAQAGCGSELYSAFISQCERRELLRDKNYSITLGGKTFNGVVFYAEKLKLV